MADAFGSQYSQYSPAARKSMKLINGYELMNYAKKNGYILPAFNTTNLEMTYAIAKGLDEAKLPGYIQISSNNLRLSNPRIIAEIARDAVSKYDTILQLCVAVWRMQDWFFIDSSDLTEAGQNLYPEREIAEIIF